MSRQYIADPQLTNITTISVGPKLVTYVDSLSIVPIGALRYLVTHTVSQELLSHLTYNNASF